jgi:hypothetical protein
VKSDFSSAQDATHKRGAGSKNEIIPFFGISAAKVTHCPHCSDTLDQQRTARTTISIVTSCYIIITNKFRKVFIRSSPVNDSKGGGKGNQRIAEFLTGQFRGARDCDTNAENDISAMNGCLMPAIQMITNS